MLVLFECATARHGSSTLLQHHQLWVCFHIARDAVCENKATNGVSLPNQIQYLCNQQQRSSKWGHSSLVFLDLRRLFTVTGYVGISLTAFKQKLSMQWVAFEVLASLIVNRVVMTAAMLLMKTRRLSLKLSAVNQRALVREKVFEEGFLISQGLQKNLLVHKVVWDMGRRVAG